MYQTYHHEYPLLYHHQFFFLMQPHPPTSTLFPYTTLFRSRYSSRRCRFCELIRDAGARRHWSASPLRDCGGRVVVMLDRKSTRLNSSHSQISYAVFCLKKKKQNKRRTKSIIHIT